MDPAVKEVIVTYGPVSIPISVGAIVAAFQWLQKRWDRHLEALAVEREAAAKKREEAQELRFKHMEIKVQDLVEEIRKSIQYTQAHTAVIASTDKGLAVLAEKMGGLSRELSHFDDLKKQITAIDPRVSKLEVKLESLIEALRRLRSDPAL